MNKSSLIVFVDFYNLLFLDISIAISLICDKRIESYSEAYISKISRYYKE